MNEQLLIDIIYFITYSMPQTYIFYICLNCMLAPKSKKAIAKACINIKK